MQTFGVLNVVKTVTCLSPCELTFLEDGIRVCSDAVLHYFLCGFVGIFILVWGIAVLEG